MTGNSNAHILIIEDNESDLFLIVKTLSKEFLGTIKSVKDGKEALLYLNKEGIYKDAETPNLIILDLRLPKITGKDVLINLKQDKGLCSIPVIIYTSSFERQDVTECYDLGANCYIMKPTELKQFENIVKSIKKHWIDNAALPYIYAC